MIRRNVDKHHLKSLRSLWERFVHSGKWKTIPTNVIMLYLDRVSISDMYQNKLSAKLQFLLKVIPFVLWIFTSACAGLTQPSALQNQPMYVPPSPQIKKSTQIPNLSAMIPTPTLTCTNSLRFVADITIPDGSQVKPNEAIEKVWEVENNGSCNWDERYRLKWIGGSELGTATEQALYPARSGTHAQIHMRLIAPQTPATYHSAWQAYDPQGVPFGDPIYVEFVVTAP